MEALRIKTIMTRRRKYSSKNNCKKWVKPMFSCTYSLDNCLQIDQIPKTNSRQHKNESIKRLNIQQFVDLLILQQNLRWFM